MALTEKSVLVEYAAAQMYALVADVPSYPEFLPWCGGAEVLREEDDVVHAAIRIDFRGIRQQFSTENRLHAPDLIEMKLVDGPFRTLDGSWRFKALGDQACRVDFRLHYEFSSRLLEKLVGPVFHYIANTFVDAFVKRAAQLYGPR
ncbi:MAG TPA: type II toxin-antitoxin system RatA family toxin [Burkholderiales bacterium]|jgi:ribosome-associated toxin RatA of RatAB toxin-antitoxin module|nr:type II toxin-antitoxin system RatA family toxin [Burkholderiales bacterium]